VTRMSKGRSGRRSGQVSPPSFEPLDLGPTSDGEDADVISYLADMIGQLESVAKTAKLDLLAYLLAMARAQAQENMRKPSEHRAKDRPNRD
jgi:hypothetical protein